MDLRAYIGIYESTNFGASFSDRRLSTALTYVHGRGGAGTRGALSPRSIFTAPGRDSFEGIYRSDDGGNTWALLNSTSQQWGGTGPLAADPNVFGRVYLGARRHYHGQPRHQPSRQLVDTDINEPGNPGWATSSTTLSTGTAVNEWNLVGGGAGFSSTPFSITSLSRTGGVATAITTTASGIQVGRCHHLRRYQLRL